MKALVYEGPNEKSLKNRAKPVLLSPTDAIIRVTRTTICGTDLHILKGDVPSCTPGRVLGHEGVGVIDEVGPGVTQFKKGDHVLISCISSCGRCEYCRRGMNSHCISGGWILGNTIDGTQAEFVRIPHADTSLYHIPEDGDEEALVMLSDILPTGFECGVLNGKIAPGNRLAIVGAGPIGLAVLLTAQFYSPSQMILIDVDEKRLAMALRFGATDVICATGAKAAQQVLALTDGMGVDVAVEAVGLPETFELCEEIVGAGGIIANIGVHGAKADLHLEKLWSENISITTRLVDTTTTAMLLKIVQSGRLNPSKLVTHRFQLDSILDAYATFSHASKTQALKVIIEMANNPSSERETDGCSEDLVGAEPADHWSCDLATRKGLIFHVRRVTKNDEPILKEFFAKVSPEDIRFRFLSGMQTVSHERMLGMIHVDHDETENFLAVLPGSKNVIATAMLACDSNSSRAEVAISVRSDYKQKGVAWELLRHLSRFAEAKGVTILESVESRENHDAIALEREQGFKEEEYPGDARLLLVRKRLAPTIAGTA